MKFLALQPLPDFFAWSAQLVLCFNFFHALHNYKQKNRVILCLFLDASSHLYKRPCPSIGWLVRWSVSPSVRKAFVKIDEKWPFMDSKWLRLSWTRKKEGRGGKSDEEEGGTRRIKKWKSQKKKQKRRSGSRTHRWPTRSCFKWIQRQTGGQTDQPKDGLRNKPVWHVSKKC